MNLQDLKQRFISATPSGHGHYQVTFEIRGKKRSCITTNVDAADRIKNQNDYRTDLSRGGRGYTLAGAYRALYYETKRKNA